MPAVLPLKTSRETISIVGTTGLVVQSMSSTENKIMNLTVCWLDAVQQQKHHEDHSATAGSTATQ